MEFEHTLTRLLVDGSIHGAVGALSDPILSLYGVNEGRPGEGEACCYTLAPMYVHCAHDFINLLIKRTYVHARKMVYDTVDLVVPS